MILVTGATGQAGSAVIREFAGLSGMVMGLSRIDLLGFRPPQAIRLNGW